ECDTQVWRKKAPPRRVPGAPGRRKKCWRKKTRNTKDLCHSRRARKGKESIGTALALRGERKRIGSESQTSCKYENPPKSTHPTHGARGLAGCESQLYPVPSLL